MLRLLLLVSDSDEDALRAILDRLVHDLDATAIDAREWIADESGRKRLAARERQRRSRARRKRDMSHDESVTCHTESDRFSTDSGGEDHSLPALEGQEGVSDTPDGHAFVTRDSHADVTRDSPRLVPQYNADGSARSNEPWTLPPMDAEQRDIGRAQSARLRDQLKGNRRP